MLDYRVRAYRKDATKPMRQVVIYLKQTESERVYQTSFEMENTRHEFEVVRIWEQPASLFLQYPELIPFASLGQSPDAEEYCGKQLNELIKLQTQRLKRI